MAEIVTREVNIERAAQLVSSALDLVRVLQSAMRRQRQGLPLTPIQLADIDRYTTGEGMTTVGACVLQDAEPSDSDADVRIEPDSL